MLAQPHQGYLRHGHGRVNQPQRHHLLLGQHLEQWTRGNDYTDVGCDDLEPRAHLRHIDGAVLPDPVVEMLVRQLHDRYVLPQLRKDGVTGYRDPRRLPVEAHHVMPLPHPCVGQTRQGEVGAAIEKLREGIVGAHCGEATVSGALTEAAEPFPGFGTGDEAQGQHAGNATVGDVNEESVLKPSGTAMKPQTAAKKLGIYLPATPEEFQANAVTHRDLKVLQEDPPQWLQDLRREGPHPRPVVAQKLGITIAALKRNELDKPLTTAEIKALLENQPDWLRAARTALAEGRAETPEGKVQEEKETE